MYQTVKHIKEVVSKAAELAPGTDHFEITKISYTVYDVIGRLPWRRYVHFYYQVSTKTFRVFTEATARAADTTDVKLAVQVFNEIALQMKTESEEAQEFKRLKNQLFDTAVFLIEDGTRQKEWDRYEELLRKFQTAIFNKNAAAAVHA